MTIQVMQQVGTTIYKVDDIEFGRWLAVEKELELPRPDGKIPGMWMQSGTRVGVSSYTPPCSALKVSILLKANYPKHPD